MSGDFVQRADFAVVRRQARAKAAVMTGVDLVLELPLPCAVSSAEGFAEGGVSLLLATGLTDTLVFGSECGNVDALQKAASVLLCEQYPAALHRELSAGISYPAARQRAVSHLAGSVVADVLSRPNDILGVEYCKALLRQSARIRPAAVLREGAPHAQDVVPDNASGFPSSTAIRALLRRGERETALTLMAPAMRTCYLEEEAAGRAPMLYETLERAILYRLRSMRRDEFAALDEGHEGLCNRLYAASRDSVSIRETLERAKTKRYPLSRLRRMLLWAALGLTNRDRLRRPAYLRPLAMNATGQKLLARMRTCATLPVLTKAADVRALGQDAQTLLQLEARAADLYALACPNPAAMSGGTVWKASPWIAPADAPLGKEVP
jgi:predicted nucleotidyltransferase